MDNHRPGKGSVARALILIALSIFLFSLVANGSLALYVNPRLTWLSLAAAIMLGLVAISFRYRSGCVVCHDSDVSGQTLPWTSILLLLLPILLGVIVPPTPLGASAMANREIGVRLSSLGAAQGRPEQVVSETDTDKNILDWVVAFQQNEQVDTFSGQRADVIGFVYRDSRLQEDEFMVGRFVVTCCVADAMPVGLVVRWPQAANLAENQWVRVTGQLEIGRLQGEVIHLLVADQVSLVEQPDMPYLFYR